MPAEPAELPFIDTHHTFVDAPPAVVWRAVGDVIRGFDSPASAGYARLVGADPARADGNAPAEGAAIPGFRVSRAQQPQRIELQGRHRFSTYKLVFELEPEGDARTRVSAHTFAVFPGVTGFVYRALVIGSRGHVFAVRRLLGSVARRAARIDAAQGRAAQRLT